jgi:hypothetical protein
MFACFVKVLEILCVLVLGCAALLPEPNHLHMLAVQHSAFTRAKQQKFL